MNEDVPKKGAIKTQQMTLGSAKMGDVVIAKQKFKVDLNQIVRAHRMMGDRIYLAVDKDGTVMAHKYMVRAGNQLWRAANEGKPDADGNRPETLKIGNVGAQHNWKMLLQKVTK
jgi:hypothetical protein